MLEAWSPEIVAFVRAYEANQRIAGHLADWQRVVPSNRRKYIAIDEADSATQRSGLFLIDRSDGTVYSIAGYGKVGYRLGTVERMTHDYDVATATYDPTRRVHTRDSRSGLAQTNPVLKQFQGPDGTPWRVLQGGQRRTRIADRLARRRGQR